MDVLQAAPRNGLTLVHALPGLVDAGNSCRIAATYLRDQLRHVPLVSFDTDELLDYRGSRPRPPLMVSPIREWRSRTCRSV